MAKNTWKYATLTEDQRLNKIKNGDAEVYNSEIRNLDNLKKARVSAGLDTTDIDNKRETLRKSFNESTISGKALDSVDYDTAYENNQNEIVLKPFDEWSALEKAQFYSLYDVEREQRKYDAEAIRQAFEQRRQNRKKAVELAENAIETAQKNISSLDEYYANNGLSTDSTSYIKEKESMKKELYDLFSEIEEKYFVTLDKKQKNTAAKIFEK